MQKERSSAFDIREQITSILEHLDHVLPGQAPIQDFVHHNTIHGFQHLPFEQALSEFEALTGICGYLSESQNREFYQQGRITDDDLSAVLSQDPKLQADEIVYTSNGLVIKRQDIYRIVLIYGIEAITNSQLNWKIDEQDALRSVQSDVPNTIRKQLIADEREADVIRQLWNSVLSKLALERINFHPETMLDLPQEQVKEWLEKINIRQANKDELQIRQKMLEDANEQLNALLTQVGESITLRGFVMALSNVDILDSIRPQLISICASAMDEGMAAWQLPERSKLGLYAAWRAAVRYDISSYLHGLSNWQTIISEIPEDAISCIILQLEHMEIPQKMWEGYLRRLALELPGWSGLINWRQHHAKYYVENDAKPHLADYLAIRLTLDRLWLNQVCQDNWGVEGKLETLRYYFHKNLSEFMVRRKLYQGGLPEYLTHLADALILSSGSERNTQSEWHKLANLMWTWQFSLTAKDKIGRTIVNSGWCLFRLCQHLGLNASHVNAMQQEDVLHMLAIVDEFNLEERSKVWLYAYERNYREAFFHAIRANHNRGRWYRRDRRPESQLIFCIDDREESFRRHLEELNPAIETFGAAGFFGVPINYKALDDSRVTPLCPVVVNPAHEVHEVACEDEGEVFNKHSQGRKLLQRMGGLLHQGLRRNLFLAQPVIDVIAPFMLGGLLAKSLLPKTQEDLTVKIGQWVSPDVKTKLTFTSLDTETVATPEKNKLGFTDKEQADRVAGFLRSSGLTYGFSELVLLVGHGSISQNNPHLAAYDCGACSGRHGGPNARLFAAMANRPEIRKLVAARGINIPDDTWFIGTEHNTCNEDIIWYDLEDVPAERHAALEKIKKEIRHVQYLSAHERCRRLASAPRNPSLKDALKHIVERASDFSQARPELGHATNASAIVGRRSISQGAFFDRRAFLISYDPTQDPEGAVLEGILLAVGPVGAGINLEYYFSTVNNERFGCGTKVPHNVTGFFGVMEGTSSDLRTGLPSQMIEIHESIRLLILIEAKTAILEKIYARQEGLRELIAGGWILLASKDPDDGEIYFFERGIGFVRWVADDKELPVYEKSSACYANQTLPVPPALIKQPEFEGA